MNLKQYFFQALFVVVSVQCVGAAIAYAQSAQVLQGEYVIQRDDSLPGPASAALSSSAYSVIGSSLNVQLVRPGGKGGAALSSRSTFTIVPFDRSLAEKDCDAIRKGDPRIISCEANFVLQNYQLPNDPALTLTAGIPLQFFHFFQQADGTNFFDLRSPFAWDVSTGSKSVVVGIVDSGINYEHPDIEPNLWVNPGDPKNGVDDDGNGYVDDVFGIDATNNTNDPFDCNGHGSHVAGIIGAKGNNGKGGAGVNWDVSIAMARNAIDCGPSVSLMSVVTGLNYFYDLKKNRGINIVAINGSYGGDSFLQSEFDALARLATVNIIFTAAAGNGGQDGIGDNLDVTPAYPAAHNLPNIISVANLDQTTYPTFKNLLNDSSNFGKVSVDIAAPGTDILSTVYKGDPGADFVFSLQERYGSKTGTSMAAPMVAGAIALYKSKHPQYIDYNRIVDLVLNTAFPVSTITNQVKTGGTLDVSGLLRAAALTDNCPSDSNKLDAGICGCGVAENYRDADNDGSPDCIDQCPTDAGKTAPGSCGCGSADSDANANGRLDCMDGLISAVTPPKPKISKKGKFAITMTPTTEPGAIYVVKIESSKKSSGGKKKKKKGAKGSGGSAKKVKFINSSTPSLKTKGPASGETFSISYFYQIPGPSAFTSQESPAVKVKGK